MIPGGYTPIAPVVSMQLVLQNMQERSSALLGAGFNFEAFVQISVPVDNLKFGFWAYSLAFKNLRAIKFTPITVRIDESEFLR